MLENDSILESLVGMETGKIIKLDPKAKYGFIGTGKDCKKYVHFKFCTVVNASGKPLSLAVEMPVHFKLGEWNHDARNQSAARVIIGPKDAMATLETMKGSSQHSKLAKLKTSSDGRNKRKDYNSNMSSKTWSIGKVCPFNPNQQHVFLKVFGQTMDVFMHKDKVSRFALELEPGDQIEFIVAEETKANRKPNALKARFYSFKERPNSELALYLEELDSDILSSPNGQLAALELVPIQSLWERLSAGGANFDESYGLLLIRVVSQLLKKCKSHSSVALPMVETVLESRVMLELLIQDQGLDCTLWEFLKEAVVALPQIAMKIFLRVKQASRTQSASNHEQLLEFTEKACMRLNNMMGGGNDTKDWRILGPVLSDKEIFSSTPCSNDENLQKIKTDGGYSSADQYSETYYRLFRAETLALIQEAIRDYRTLTSTNHKPKSQSTLSIFQNVKLVGYEIDRSVSVILQFNQIGAGVRDWARTRRLMFGNLMCLSPDQEFRGENLIWATVSNRDEDLLKKNCIALELFQEFNTLSIAAIISLLLTCEGRTVMIESPTYFHPMGCVLQTFKDMDVESFQLVEQIVYAKSDTNGVTYLRQRSKTIAKLCDQLNLPLSRHENTFISEKKDTIEMSVEKEVVTALNKLEMNKSQLKAFLHAMTNPLTIIQGPPGCGKTFIGLMLAKVILKCELPTPVLVLTYKNHALDEFLKGMIKCGACGAGDIVRVGGGSQDPAMEDCNLTKLAREESHGRALNDRYYDLKREVTHLTEEFKVVSEELNRKSFLTLQMLISQLNTEQLVHLVCKAKWCNRAGGNLVHKVNKSSYVDKQWILGTALPFVDKHFGGIKPFADLCCSESTCLPVLDDRKGDAAFKTMCEHVRDVIWKATNIWLPDRTLMKKLQQLQEKFSLNCQSVPANEADKKTMVSKLANNEEELDDDEMEELFQDRITSRKPSFSGVRVRLNDTKESEIVFKHNDLPKNVAVPDITLLSQETLWDFDDINRFKFLHALISNQRDKVHQRFDEVLSQLNETLAHLKALKTNKNMVTARKRKVIGMTITGASLYSDLMQIVKPSVVIVEEAAEILETSLFAALNKDVEHLILIGDHKQLRPGVESYELVKHYSFDISMMERLIKCGFPYKSLDTQGRMRPEFSALLKDIYPNLKDNLALVRANKPLDCLQHSMYFWTHNHIESGMVPNDAEESKSKYNKAEAQMVVALVKFLIHSGVKKKKSLFSLHI